MATPVLRIFDLEKAKEFYCEFLGFDIKWEHRFEANFPIYMEIARENCIIHLSEHHGDGVPGTLIRIETEEINQLYQSLIDKNYKYAKPGIEETPWNMKEVRVGDPFGNRIVFFERG